ncbi:MAG: hypothetical protein R3C53_27965 [Pirellulaceae bacterium]
MVIALCTILSSTQAIPSGRVCPLPFEFLDASSVEDDSCPDEDGLRAVAGWRSRPDYSLPSAAIDARCFTSLQLTVRFVEQLVAQQTE